MKIINKELLRQKLEATINSDIDANNLAGAAAIVMQNNQMLCDLRLGYKNAETKETLAPKTMFRLASMSKPITAVAVLLQCQRGLLCVDDKVSKYIPSFWDMDVGKPDADGNPVKDCAARREITVSHLLTHTSGLMTDEIGMKHFNDIPPAYRQTLETITDYYGEHTLLAFSPGEKALYSPIGGFDVLSRLVEITAGMPYDEFLRREMFEPLDMPDTAFCPSDEQWQRMCAMHNKAEGRSINVDMGRYVFGNFPPTYFAGGAGLAGSIEDYGHFAEMLLGDGSYRGKMLLKLETVKAMRTPHVSKEVMGRSVSAVWGYGVRVIVGRNTLPVGCFGWSGAYGTHFWIDPENKIAAIYMKNSYYDGGSGALTAQQFEKDVMSAVV